MERGADRQIRQIRRYYDRNTGRFLRFGHGGVSAAIHRAVWAPGVEERRGAMEYVNALVLKTVVENECRNVLDLGCGVGGTLSYLATRHSARYRGLTLSRVQAETGRSLLARNGVAAESAVTLHAGDFHRRSVIGGPYDAAYAIEALLHAADLRRVVDNVAAALEPGGLFVVCDDFLRDAPLRSETANRMVSRFREGWHAPGLTRLSELGRHCRDSGLHLENERDLTPYLELGRPRDRLIRALMIAASWLPLRTPWWNNMRGGDALQRCLSERWIVYRFVVFRRESS